VKLSVKNQGLENQVKFLGIREDIHRIMQALDLFVMPSVSEGFPVTLVEAQAAGLKSLVSDGVCYDVNLTEEIQYKSLEDDAFEWSEKIWSMICENWEVDDKIGMNEKVIEKGYDIKENAKWLEAFYEITLSKAQELHAEKSF
jgi:glycosyltransferase involved in cell wall biosynthesis